METSSTNKLKAALLGLKTSKVNEYYFRYSMEELALLADTAQIEVITSYTQNKHNPDSRLYFGKGKITEIAEDIKIKKPDIIIVDDELSPSQQKNMETALREETGLNQLKIVDRTELILLIFAQRANTKEAILQVELAALSYQLPRLSRMWEHLGRQVGKIGTRGPGEKQIEVDRRTIRNKISFLSDKIEEIKNQRELHRKKRLNKTIPTAAIIGYTNAGKSTLLNKLTNANVLAEDKLFATLDTTTRKMRLPGNQEILLIDTVGFINKLPHSLVSAFRATLEEVEEADFFIHVVDISAPNPRFLIDSVYHVLEELKVANKPMITLLNKIDRLENKEILDDYRKKYYPCTGISLKEDIGIENAMFLIEELLSQYRKTHKVLIPFDHMNIVDFLHQKTTIIEENYEKNGVKMEIEMKNDLLHIIKDYIIE
ncbi:MAG TPA: GTPase HflX [Candidatus Margulisbacteria bacterium]|nr:MAG: GTPase HflX [Candidatus Margulisbacteria bacterium GWD2_39_127]OGI04166.1 MAG: GTPase HflX [Candidatus Margulisbacteria bacterium GWF2_38_17]OGI09300.1 MAG: GTPase HflX [Candidatus Margulisbacteria bacterium GWE2_39_32]HAR63949.1 GTPase HflX [Candidatus Margulisiibacteriota bacterium]HCT83888.1 GTPase HflX [Candidatus Margulisiibacteriota bacterium]